jgi:hypothetical protein
MDNEQCCPVGPGGNITIINQDEQAILNAFVAAVPIRDAGAATEDDSHVVMGYHEPDVAGS